MFRKEKAFLSHPAHHLSVIISRTSPSTASRARARRPSQRHRVRVRAPRSNDHRAGLTTSSRADGCRESESGGGLGRGPSRGRGRGCGCGSCRDSCSCCDSYSCSAAVLSCVQTQAQTRLSQPEQRAPPPPAHTHARSRAAGQAGVHKLTRAARRTWLPQQLLGFDAQRERGCGCGCGFLSRSVRSVCGRCLHAATRTASTGAMTRTMVARRVHVSDMEGYAGTVTVAPAVVAFFRCVV